MGTRSLIILEDNNYRTRGIYCLSDGYPTGVGLGLVIGYRKAAMARRLVSVGAIGGMRFTMLNAQLSHKLFSDQDSDFATFDVLRCAAPIGDKEMHPYLADLITKYCAEYVYWGRVVTCDGVDVVEWTCIDSKGNKVDLYSIPKTKYVGKAYDVVQDVYGWKVIQYGMDCENEEYCGSEYNCYKYIEDNEFSPERDAIRGIDKFNAPKGNN